MSDAAELSNFCFQRGAFASQDKLLRGHDEFDGSSNLTTYGCVLRREIELRHRVKRGGNLRM